MLPCMDIDDNISINKDKQTEMGDQTEEVGSLAERLGRAVYINVDLDAVIHNMRLMQEGCKNRNIGLMCVVKANAYGHGAVPVAHHLKANGVERLAVGTVAEGVQLRQGGIPGPIHVLGNVQSWEMPSCVQHHLVPTVSSSSAVEGMADVLKLRRQMLEQLSSDTDLQIHRSQLPVGTVHIKVDTGMSRNGCQPHHLAGLLQLCRDLHVPVEGIFSHFADHDNAVFTNQQLLTYQQCIEPYRNEGLVFHMSGSGAVILGHGTEYDFIRPGISLFGVSGSVENLEDFIAKGFRPALSVKAIPTLVKQCQAGTKVGYSCTYTCTQDMWLATFPVGYADGIWRCLSDKGCIVRDKTGEKCPYLGRVSMDSLTVQLPCQPDPDETFTIVTADFDPATSATGIAGLVDTIPNEVLTRLSTRLPRVFYTAKAGYVASVEALELNTGVSCDDLAPPICTDAMTLEK